MPTLSNVLCDVLNDKDEICRLCFETVEETSVRIQDQVVLNHEKDTDNFGNILDRILGSEMSKNFSLYDRVCEKCFKLALSSFSFITMCKENSMKLHQAIECVTSVLENTIVNNNGSKSMFLTFNINNSTSHLYYDTKRCLRSKNMILKRYMSLTNEKRKRSQKETECYHNIKYTAENDLISAIKMVNGKKKYFCKYCPKVCKTLINLRKHYINIHEKRDTSQSQQNSFVCFHCGKTYKSRKYLKAHEQHHKVQITCSKCNRIYKHMTSFKTHVCRPENESVPLGKQFVCDHCGAEFARKPTLILHVKFEHGNGKAQVCSWCNKRFYSVSALKLHIVKHTKEKNYKCEICGGQYVTKASLIYHARIHTGETPFKCKFCDIRFLSTSRRADHIRRHHMEPSLPCKLCLKKFKSYSTLHKHRKRHADPSSSLYIFQKYSQFG